MQEIIEEGLPLPAINQCPFHLYRSFSQDAVRSFCEQHQIHCEGETTSRIPHDKKRSLVTKSSGLFG